MGRWNIQLGVANTIKNLPWRGVILGLVCFYFFYVSLALQRFLPVPYFLVTPIGLIPYYVLAIFLGGVIAVWFLRKLKTRVIELKELSILDLLLWTGVGGLFLGRGFHVLEFSVFYFNNPAQIANLTLGGISILGSMLGGLLGLFLYSKRSKINFSLILKHLLVVWPIVFAVGRSGNFFNRQLYGLPTEVPWSMYIEPEFRYKGYESVANYHPLFLYEQILNLCLWLVMLRQYRRGANAASLFKFYAVGYLLGRFMLDFLRLESRFMLGLTFTQVFILGLLLIAITGGWLWQLWWKYKHGSWWQPKS